MHQSPGSLSATNSVYQSRDATQLVLASASPRRHELLALLGVSYTIITTDAEDSDDPVPESVIAALPSCPLNLIDHPTLRAWRKVQVVSMSSGARVVLGADTVVVLDGTVLNKPRDEAHARAMLAQLSGRTHTVYTGLCVSQPNGSGKTLTPEHVSFDLVASEVAIAALTAEMIAAYVATGEPMDKAGAYGIQGLGGKLVQRVRGSYTAVVGLPLPATWHLLTTAGVTGLKDPLVAYQNWLYSQGKEPLPCPPTLP
ncbi:MAG: Maf family protein [Chloroflexales bacterium]|nr:Maf family protein [Chloroflexales bacterium]